MRKIKSNVVNENKLQLHNILGLSREELTENYCPSGVSEINCHSGEFRDSDYGEE